MKDLQWISGKKAAEIMGLANQTLTGWRCEGIGPPYTKVGFGVRYEIGDVIRFMKANTVVPKGKR